MEIIYFKEVVDTQDVLTAIEKFTYPKDSYKGRLLIVLKVLD